MAVICEICGKQFDTFRGLNGHRNAHIKRAESYKPPASAVKAAKKGLAQRKEWGRGGLSPSEAKSQGIDSGVTRARKIASGSVSRHDVRRMSAFNRHRKNNRPDKKMPDGGPTAGTIAWNLWGGTSGVNWAKKKSAAMNAETFNALSPICKRCGLSEAGSHQLDPTGETGICIICTFNQKMGLNAEGRFSAEKYYEEDPERYYNPQFEPYDSFPTKDSAEQLYIKTKDFINTWSEGWDDYRTANQENGGYFTSLNAVKKDANKEAKYYARKGYFPFYQSEDSSGINFTCQKSEDGKRTYNRAFNTYSEPLKDYTERVEIKYELIEKMGAETFDAEEKLSKTSCCCGADESDPCACMKAPEPMSCRAKEPKCACYKALEKNAEDSSLDYNNFTNDMEALLAKYSQLLLTYETEYQEGIMEVFMRFKPYNAYFDDVDLDAESLDDSYDSLYAFIKEFSEMGNDYVSDKGAEYLRNHLTIYHAESFGPVDEDGQLAKALAAVRDKAKRYAPTPLRLTKLPHPDQKTLKDFEADWRDLSRDSSGRWLPAGDDSTVSYDMTDMSWMTPSEYYQYVLEEPLDISEDIEDDTQTIEFQDRFVRYTAMTMSPQVIDALIEENELEIVSDLFADPAEAEGEIAFLKAVKRYQQFSERYSAE